MIIAVFDSAPAGIVPCMMNSQLPIRNSLSSDDPMDIQLPNQSRSILVLAKNCGTKGFFLDCEVSLTVERSAALIRRQAVPLKMPDKVNIVRLYLNWTSFDKNRLAC